MFAKHFTKVASVFDRIKEIFLHEQQTKTSTSTKKKEAANFSGMKVRI